MAGSPAGGWSSVAHDPVDPLQVLGVVGDDQRVGRRVRHDRVVRRDQRPQHVDELLRRLELERDDLGHQPVAAGAGPAGGDGAAVLLGVGLRHDLDEAVAFDRREALQAQRGQQRRVDEAHRHGPRRHDVDRAFDPRVDDEIAAGDLGHRLDHRVDVGVDEIERHRGAVGRPGGRDHARGEHQQCRHDPGASGAGGAVADDFQCSDHAGAGKMRKPVRKRHARRVFAAAPVFWR